MFSWIFWQVGGVGCDSRWAFVWKFTEFICCSDLFSSICILVVLCVVKCLSNVHICQTACLHTQSWSGCSFLLSCHPNYDRKTIIKHDTHEEQGIYTCSCVCKRTLSFFPFLQRIHMMRKVCVFCSMLEQCYVQSCHSFGQCVSRS